MTLLVLWQRTLFAVLLLLICFKSSAQQVTPSGSKALTNAPAAAAVNYRSNGLTAGQQQDRSAKGRPTYRAGSAARPLVTPFQYPLTDCFTYTYRLQTGMPNINTYIKGTVTTSNGETYTVGYTADAAGNTTGLIQQLNYTGGIGFTKAVGLTGRQVVLNSIGQLPDGNLVVIGSYKNAVGGVSRLLLASLDEDGGLLWCKSLDYAGVEGIAVCSDPVNGIGFAGYINQNLLCGRLDNAGNLVWLKQLPLTGYGNVVGMVNNSFENWYIACNSVQAGVHTGVLVSINPADGVLQWANQYGGAAVNQQFIFSELAIANSRPRVAGIFSTGANPYTLCKLTVNAGAVTEHMQVFEVPSVSFDSTARVAIDAQAQVLAFLANKNDPDIYAIKTIPEAGADTSWNWAKKFTVAGNHQFLHAQQTFDAGLIIASDLPVAAGTTQALILKTDSTGAITNCEGAGFSFRNSKVLADAVPYPATAVNQVAAMVVENALVTNAGIPADFSCKTLTCPVQPPEDSCLVSFARRFRSVGLCDLGSDLLPQSSEVIFAGLMRNDAVKPEEGEGMLGRLDSRGKLLDRKKIKLGNVTDFYQLLQLRDGNFIALGTSSYGTGNNYTDTGYFTVSKFTPTLQFVWNKSLPPINSYFAVATILEDADGSLFLKYVASNDVFCLKTGVIKLDAQGNLLWIKEYEAAGQCGIATAGSMTQDDRYLYLVNWTNADAGNQFIKVDKSTGLPVLATRLVLPDAYQWRGGETIAMLGDNILLLGVMSLTNGNSRNTLVLVDKNGAVLKQTSYSVLNNQLGVNMIVTRNHEIVLSGSIEGYSCFIRLDSSFNILYSKKTGSSGAAERAIREDATGALVSIGYWNGEDPYKIDLCYKKLTYDGKLGSCFTDSLLLDTESHLVNQTPLTAVATNRSINVVTLPYQEASYSLQNAQLLCAQVSNCSAIRLQAPASVCDTLVQVANVVRNAGCTLPVSFTQSNANLKIISSTDSTVSFKMLQSGSTKLVASVFTGCNWLRDSVQISSSVGNPTFSLGNDTSICPGNALIIRPGTGYLSYTWNDGSTADTLKVTAPGTYFVTVTNGCGGTLADTLVVRAATPAPISIGPDRIKCNDEAVSLSASAGFISYSWGPSYQLVPVSDSQVAVSPLKDTSYFIRAEKTPGCFAFDTVMIKVSRSAPIDLGADKSFCAGDSLLLDAGSSFTNYGWNTGAMSQTIKVFSRGTYAVSAANQFGCVSKDTLVVVNVFANPVVQLGNDFSLCKGSTQTLDAGVFSSYLWSDLSTSRTLQVNTTGLYAVTVTDQNNCVGSDTVVVASILPLPANFLPADTALCQYETLQLSASGDYNSYLWSTNSADKTITVKSPGQFWLQVTDRNNCVGKDSITISLKKCVAGFYIPSAFTPNDDGLNDVFKPILLGNVLQYRFVIYNRYGQVVFETTDLKAGWDGKVNGTGQIANGFTWVCWYLMEGSVSKMEKGNVVLVK